MNDLVLSKLTPEELIIGCLFAGVVAGLALPTQRVRTLPSALSEMFLGFVVGGCLTGLVKFIAKLEMGEMWWVAGLLGTFGSQVAFVVHGKLSDIKKMPILTLLREVGKYWPFKKSKD